MRTLFVISGSIIGSELGAQLTEKFVSKKFFVRCAGQAVGSALGVMTARAILEAIANR